MPANAAVEPDLSRLSITTSATKIDAPASPDIDQASTVAQTRTHPEPTQQPASTTSTLASGNPHGEPMRLEHLYVVYRTQIVRKGRDAAIEAPAVRSTILAVCSRPERARELAQRAWRQTFAYAVPEDEVETFDGIAHEHTLCGDEYAPRHGWVSGPVARGEVGGEREVVDVGRGGFRGGTELWRRVNREFVDGDDGTVVGAGERAVRIERVGVDCLGEGQDGVGGGGRTPVSA